MCDAFPTCQQLFIPNISNISNMALLSSSSISSNDRIREYVDAPVYMILNQKANDDVQNVEDILKITPDYSLDNSQPDQTFYRVEWTDGRNTHRKIRGITKTFMTTRDQLFQYVNLILDMVEKDQIPYHSMDLLIPCFPSVSFASKSFSEVRPTIIKSLELFL